VKAIEWILSGSRYLVLLGVAGTLLAALCVFFGSGLLAVKIAIEMVSGGLGSAGSIKAAAVDFMRVVDLFLIAIAFLIISVGMYRLFINPDFDVPGPMAVGSFTELKRALASIVAVVLLIIFLDYVVTNGATELVLELGLAIAAVIIAAAWTIGQLGKGDH
jgi:uncharacterized membrane protein YqhA